jgi:hypothetical protein
MIPSMMNTADEFWNVKTGEKWLLGDFPFLPTLSRMVSPVHLERSFHFLKLLTFNVSATLHNRTLALTRPQIFCRRLLCVGPLGCRVDHTRLNSLLERNENKGQVT